MALHANIGLILFMKIPYGLRQENIIRFFGAKQCIEDSECSDCGRVRCTEFPV